MFVTFYLKYESFMHENLNIDVKLKLICTTI